MSTQKINLSSGLEWQIMKYLWENTKASVRDVWESIFPEGDKAYTTVQTYMERMVKKGLLKKEKIGLVNFYSPLISEKEALKEATENFVDKAFEGSFGLLANFLVNSDKLKASDLKELKKMLENRSED